MKLNYSEGFKKANVNAVDIMNCLDQILSDVNGKFIDCDVLTIRSYEKSDKANFPLMVDVKIEFITFYPPNINIHYTWKCFRAKDFSCSQSSWKKEKFVEVN
jgi:hypothetical protein